MSIRPDWPVIWLDCWEEVVSDTRVQVAHMKGRRLPFVLMGRGGWKHIVNKGMRVVKIRCSICFSFIILVKNVVFQYNFWSMVTLFRVTMFPVNIFCLKTINQVTHLVTRGGASVPRLISYRLPTKKIWRKKVFWLKNIQVWKHKNCYISLLIIWRWLTTPLVW